LGDSFRRFGSFRTSKDQNRIGKPAPHGIDQLHPEAEAVGSAPVKDLSLLEFMHAERNDLGGRVAIGDYELAGCSLERARAIPTNHHAVTRTIYRNIEPG
jgi:hypothetical protein